MNGETHELCRLTTEVKMALREKRELIYLPEPEKFRKILEFHFLPEKETFKDTSEVVHDPAAWYSKLREQGIEDIKMLLPINVKDRHLLGFANTSRGSIVTFLKNREVHYWIADWKHDKELKKWRVTYTEYEWKETSTVRTSFINNTEEEQKHA